MGHIKISRGLDIPIKGKPTGSIQSIVPSGESAPLMTPKTIALDLKPFDYIKFRLLVKPGDVVNIGQPLAEDKSTPGRVFVSPAGGSIVDIRRGPKRVLEDIIIDVAKEENYQEFSQVNLNSKEEIIERMLTGGSFSRIHSRPFNLLANPHKPPRSIFVKAIESAPFLPPAELQVEGHEKEFQMGLDILSKLSTVHLVHRLDSPSQAFTQAKNVQRHTAEGPHPIANPSIHIEKIDPIRSADTIIWTLNAHDVVEIGHLFLHNKYYIEKIISIAGPAILPDRIGYFKCRAGFPIKDLISGRIQRGAQIRLISGDPLMGQKVSSLDYLCFNDYSFCTIPEGHSREFLHFLGLGLHKYTFSKAYLTGHLNNENREYPFTTNQHGEHRAFIDPTLYDEVMPLNVPTMLLVKALMAEDYELAETYGLLEVDSEDFALPTFVCPSKIEMIDIVKNGLRLYSKELSA